MEAINKRIDELKDEVTDIRRDIHMHPETAFEEFRTSELVYDYLSRLNLDVKKGVNKTGVVADLTVPDAKHNILLRADMDALPIQEENAVPYKSKIDGKMHACGHDAHTAILLTTAKVLSEFRDYLKVNVRFVFQPSEERDPGGALGMIESGVLDSPKIDYAFALHVSGFSKVNTVLINDSTMTAESDGFKIVVHGSGGHGAYPHKTVNPILISTQIINTLQSITSREIDPLEPAVLSFGKISSGNVFDVIPEVAEIEGTVRTLKIETAEYIKKRIESISKEIAATFKGSASVEYKFGYPPVINNKEAAELIRNVAVSIVGKQNVFDTPVSMVGEDMAYILQRVKGAFYWLGVLNKEKGVIYPIHSPKFDIDEDVLTTGMKLHTYTVLKIGEEY
jgi:amidohydrolase